MYITIHPYFEDKIMIKYSQTEIVDNVNEIKHDIARECLREFNSSKVDITSIADIPAGTGLGSSSAYAVGVIHGLSVYSNRKIYKELLAQKACEIEINKLGKPIGKQDQYACAYGGLNFISFHPNGKVFVEPIFQSDHLDDNLIMFYLGKQREEYGILLDQKSRTIENFATLKQLSELARTLYMELKVGNNSALAYVLDEAWSLKKTLSSGISNSNIDHWYSVSRKNGSKGGKLLGAGGGGFLLCYCPLDDQEKLTQAMHPLKSVKVEFDYQGSYSYD
jgi:D-glycero-alpha-D-manno-heptose-7-phosphate kinase